MREMPVWQRFAERDWTTKDENFLFFLRSFGEKLSGIEIALGGGGDRDTAEEQHGQKLSAR
jgi:hypothetical protein